jgi:HlyD family type I secretion membrane fusion protein
MSLLAERLSISGLSYNDPARPALWGLAAILAFVLMFVVWGYAAPLSSAAIAEGSLQVEAQRQSVQHPYGGIAEKIFVTEGQRVEQGQVLIKLDDTEARAKLDVANAEVVALLAEQERLICERDGTGPAELDRFGRANQGRDGMGQALANERAVMLARSRQYEAEKGMLASKVAQLKEKIAGLKAQIGGLTRQQASVEEELEGARKLLSSGYGPKTRVLALERTSAQMLADRGSRMADLAGAEQAIGEAELAIAKQERDRIMDITNQLRSTQSALAEALPKLDAAQDVLDRTVIRAPMGGSIVGLSIFTEGGVVQAGARLMDIIPANDPMIVDARLPLYDINDVRPGFTADIRLTGVPRSERPQLKGEVISVSADKITDQATGASYFSVRVRLDPDDVKKAKIGLQPGMPAEVVVATQSRTLASYLLGPLLDEIGRAFREK